MGEGALGKRTGLPCTEEGLEGSTKLLLAAPSCWCCAHTHPLGNVLHDALAVRGMKLLRFARSNVTQRSLKQKLLPCSRPVWCRGQVKQILTLHTAQELLVCCNKHELLSASGAHQCGA